jgi:organic hydroperoxide reductase OsmC/OhrA
METKKSYKVFKYRAEVRWASGRRGEATAEGRPPLAVSSPPEFKGEPGMWTPEELFLASLNACTLQTFLAYAHHKGLAFSSYACSAEGTLSSVEGKYRFTEITLRPILTVASTADTERARQILGDAHRDCFISNSITATVNLVPEVRVSA